MFELMLMTTVWKLTVRVIMKFNWDHSPWSIINAHLVNLPKSFAGFARKKLWWNLGMIPLHVMERENLVAFEFFQNTFLTFCTFYISIARNQPGYSEAKKEISWTIFSELYSHLTQFYCWKILQWLFIKVIMGHDLSPRKTKANLFREHSHLKD